jgi:hypothetical protein
MNAWRNLCAALGAIAVASLVPAAFAQQPPSPAPPQRVTIGYVEVAGDARYEPITGFGRLVLKTRERPFAGAQVGLDEAQALTRVLKTEFALERISVPSSAEVAAAVVQARDARGIQFFIVDAPAGAFKPLAAAVRGRDVLIFNATAAVCAYDPEPGHGHGWAGAISGLAQVEQSACFRRPAPGRCGHGQSI